MIIWTPPRGDLEERDAHYLAAIALRAFFVPDGTVVT